jgi:hypothetical protein
MDLKPAKRGSQSVALPVFAGGQNFPIEQAANLHIVDRDSKTHQINNSTAGITSPQAGVSIQSSCATRASFVDRQFSARISKPAYAEAAR